MLIKSLCLINLYQIFNYIKFSYTISDGSM